MANGIKVQGLKEVQLAIKRNEGWIKGALAVAVYQEGLALEALSVKEVPVDDGVLKGSHFVSPPEEVSGNVTVEVGYGTEYAVPQHERMDYRHTVGKAKYLEDPLNLRRRGYAKRLALRTKNAWNKGQTTVTISSPVRPNPPGKPNG